MHSRTVFVVREKVVIFARWALVAECAALLIFKGGTPFPLTEIFAVFAGLTLVLAAFEPYRNGSIARYALGTIVFLAIITGIVLFQMQPIAEYANPVWNMLDAETSAIEPTIAVSSGQWMWSLTRLSAPYVVFLATLSLFQFERDIERLFRILVAIGTLFSFYGILQLLFFPNWLLYSEKLHYIGNLTGTLVNRNSAATFLGLTLTVTLCLIRWDVRSGGQQRNLKKHKIQFGEYDLTYGLLALLAASFLQVMALGMTSSRGGLLATVVALIAVFLLLKFRLFENRQTAKWLSTAVILLIVVAVLPLFAGQTLFRLETQAGEGRLCAFASTWHAAIVNLPFGTGLGTFQDVFPAYRNPACGIMGLWDKAHNSYLENFLELGVVYPILLLTGLFVVSKTLSYGYRNRRETRPFVTCGIGATLLVALHAFVDFSLQIPGVSVFYALILGASFTTSLGRVGPSS